MALDLRLNLVGTLEHQVRDVSVTFTVLVGLSDSLW